MKLEVLVCLRLDQTLDRTLTSRYSSSIALAAFCFRASSSAVTPAIVSGLSPS